MNCSWSIPKDAKIGDEYTIELTIDTGPVGGVVTGTGKLVVTPNEEAPPIPAATADQAPPPAAMPANEW